MRRRGKASLRGACRPSRSRFDILRGTHRPPACSRRAGGKRAFERPPRDRPKELTQILRSAGEHVPRRWVLGEPKPADGPFSGGRITGESPPARLLHARGRVGSVAYNPSVNSRTACSRLTLQTRDLDAQNRDFPGNWGDSGGTRPTGTLPSDHPTSRLRGDRDGDLVSRGHATNLDLYGHRVPRGRVGGRCYTELILADELGREYGIDGRRSDTPDQYSRRQDRVPEHAIRRGHVVRSEEHTSE